MSFPLKLCGASIEQKNRMERANFTSLHDISNGSTLQDSDPSIACLSAPAKAIVQKDWLEEIGKSALDIMVAQEEKRSLITSIMNFDDMTNGGFPTGSGVTEICGFPGSGKTQLCMQWAVNVQLPTVIDGLESHCIYIDTEGSFIADRMLEIAAGLSLRLANVHATLEAEGGTNFNIKDYDKDNIMSRVHVIRAFDLQELMIVVKNLPNFIRNAGYKVGLVIIDSIAFPFRFSHSTANQIVTNSLNVPNNNQVQLPANSSSNTGPSNNHNYKQNVIRLESLGILGSDLANLSRQFDLIVVVTNHMTSNFVNGIRTHLPALGERWCHLPTLRMICERKPSSSSSLSSVSEGTDSVGVRVLRIFKSSTFQPGEVLFEISENGIQDYLLENEE